MLRRDNWYNICLI